MKKKTNDNAAIDADIPGTSKQTEKIQIRKKNSNRRQQHPKGPHIGQVIDLAEIGEVGLIPQPVEQKRRQPRKAPTGTEEILGTLDINDDVGSQLKTKTARGKKGKVAELEPFVNSMITKSNLQSTSIKVQPAKIYPVPLAQPAHWLNKYATKKLPLEEPRFRNVNDIGKMIFHENSLQKRFDGTKACSKVAGNFFKQIFRQKNGYDGLFIMQLPSSLRVMNNDNVDKLVDEDIRLKEQNLNVENPDLTGPLFVENYSQRNEPPKASALQNFKHDQPFGKIQVFKSGRVVLKIGNRQLDIITTSPSQEHDMGAIFDHQGIMRTNPQQVKPPLNQRIPTLNILGKIDQYFSAFYDYNSILEELSPDINGFDKKVARQEPVEVDLTVDQPENLPSRESSKRKKPSEKQKSKMTSKKRPTVKAEPRELRKRKSRK
ncbi:hypothetical protein FO519_001120 [Halicephalobus sp. NKZ332]|nr:hypothetical protein FO519_001120 [Halicephalobus sp. NKZ332]